MKKGEAKERVFFLGIEALAHPVRFLIATSLGGDKKLRFTDIKKRTGIRNNATLDYHLKKLEKAQVIANNIEVIKLKDGTRMICSWYSLTPSGRKLLEGVNKLKSSFLQNDS